MSSIGLVVGIAAFILATRYRIQREREESHRLDPEDFVEPVLFGVVAGTVAKELWPLVLIAILFIAISETIGEKVYDIVAWGNSGEE